MADDFGYGEQNPDDSGSDFQMIAFLVRQMIAKIVTMKLVEVIAVHSNGEVAAAGTVDVRPLVNQVDGAGHPTAHGTVYGLPWYRLQGGTAAVIVDPVAGDIGYVSVSDRDISTVKESKKRGNPGSRRRFDLADGVYVGGCLNVAPEQYLVFTADGVRLVDKSGNVVSMASTGITLTPATGMPVKVVGNMVVEGNLMLSGNFESETGGTYAGDLKVGGNVISHFGTAGQVGLSTHHHTQPPDGHGDAEQNTSTGVG